MKTSWWSRHGTRSVCAIVLRSPDRAIRASSPRIERRGAVPLGRGLRRAPRGAWIVARTAGPATREQPPFARRLSATMKFPSLRACEMIFSYLCNARCVATTRMDCISESTKVAARSAKGRSVPQIEARHCFLSVRWGLASRVREHRGLPGLPRTRKSRGSFDPRLRVDHSGSNRFDSIRT